MRRALRQAAVCSAEAARGPQRAAARTLLLPSASNFHSKSNPLSNCPNTVCLPSSQGVARKRTKNWLPLLSGPLLAMDSSPSPLCGRAKVSSGNLAP